MSKNKIKQNIIINWREKRFKEVLKVGSGKDYKHLNSGNIPVFGTGGYMLSVDDFLYSGETVFIGRKGTIDKPFYFSGKFWTVDTLFYTYDFKNTTAKYINYIFKKINWKLYNEASGVPSLSKTTIENIKFNFPSLSEQNRIVAILETWDKYLEKLSRKIEIKKNIKKGLMQRLLTGDVRLKGFDGEWLKVILEDCFKNIGGTSLEEFVNKHGKYKFISIGNYSIFGHYIDNKQRIGLNNKTSQKLLNKEDLVMVLNDKTSSGTLIGATILIDKDDKYIYNQRSERLIPEKKIISKYMWHFLNGNFRKKVYAISQGGTQIYVNFPSVKKINIKLPNIKEQTAIAKILTTADKEIETLEQKKKNIEDQKKYLLNNLITGKIRTI